MLACNSLFSTFRIAFSLVLIITALTFASNASVIYSTYLGGIGEDVISSIAVDAVGNVNVAGYTNSANFPTTQDGVVIAPSIDNTRDAFIARLNASGSALTYSTYLGVRGFDTVNDIVLDEVGRTYVVGNTSSSGFRTTSGSFQSTKPSQNSGFVVNLSFLRIVSASVADKKLIVRGEGFDKGAVILINGPEQRTRNDYSTP